MITRSVSIALSFITLLLLTVATGTEAQAQSQLGPHLGINVDTDDFFIGGNGHFPISSIVLNPRLDFYLSDNVTNIGLNGNLYYQFGEEKKSVVFHAGGGLAMLYTSHDGGSDTDFGFNLLGGMKFTAGLRWLTQVELTFKSGSSFEILFGPIFEL